MLTQYDEIQPPREHIGIPGSHTALPALQVSSYAGTFYACEWMFALASLEF